MKYQIACTVIKQVEIPEAKLGEDLMADKAAKREEEEQTKLVDSLKAAGWNVSDVTFDPDDEDENDEDEDDDEDDSDDEEEDDEED